MTILSSRDGKFYDVPDGDLKKHAVPADQVKGIMAEMDDGMDDGPGGVEPYGAQVIINVSGSGVSVDDGGPDDDDDDDDVEPYHRWGHGWGYGYNPYRWHRPRRRRRRRHYYY